MTVSVVADGMAFFDHLADQFRIVPDKIADNEKSGGSVVVFQRFQDRRGVSIFIAAVKGQIQFFFFSILGEPGVIFLQFLYGGVSSGTFSLFRETKAPVLTFRNGRNRGFQGGDTPCQQMTGEKGGGKQKENLETGTGRNLPDLCDPGSDFPKQGRKFLFQHRITCSGFCH